MLWHTAAPCKVAKRKASFVPTYAHRVQEDTIRRLGRDTIAIIYNTPSLCEGYT